MEEKQKDNSLDVFAELAKVKSSPTPLKIEVADTPVPVMEEAEDESEGQLTVDVYRNGNDTVVVQSTVAGVSPEDLEINITNESVTIRGTRGRTEKVEDKDYFYQECFWGRFSRSVILPFEVDPEKSTATVRNGVLTVRLPRLNRQKVKKLKVKSD
ncbi:MAG: Hsp20/alpha crystallin family protein [Candidatus Jorgensenbacteria bacterium]